MATLISLLLLAVLSASVCYGIGLFVIKACGVQRETLFEMFFALVIGLCILTSLYALISTGGQTVLAILLLPLAVALWLWRQAPDAAPVAALDPAPRRWQNLLVMLGATLVFAGIRCASIYDPAPGQIMTALQDYVFYSKTTYALNLRGVEYPFINPLAAGSLSAQPYHYFDLWANALLVKMSSLPSVLLLNSVVYGVLLATAFIGFAAVYERYITRRVVIFALAFLSVFTCDTYLAFFKYIHFLTGSAEQNIYTMPVVHPKTIPVIIFLLLGYHFILEGRYAGAAWVWAALAMVYTVVTPAVYVGGGSLIIYLFLRKRITLPRAVQALAGYVFVAVFVGAFYWLSSHLHPSDQSYTLSYSQYLPGLPQLRTVVNNIVGLLLSQFFCYLLYWALIVATLGTSRKFAGLWQEYEVLFVSMLLFAGAAACAGSIFFRATDGFQLSINLMQPLLISSIAILLAVALWRSGLRPQLFAIALLTGLVVYNLRAVVSTPYPLTASKSRHDAGFIRQVSELSPHLSQYGALMPDTAGITSVHGANSDISTVGMFVSLVRDNTVLMSLTGPTIDTSRPPYNGDIALANQFVHNAPFSQFVRQQRLAGRFKTIADSQRDFLVQNGINFVCVSSQVELPETLRPLVSRALVDPVSKQKLVVLNIPLQPSSRPSSEQLVRYAW